MVHKMVRPDHDRCLHDHPWRFISLVLYGGYYEEIDGLKQPRWNYPGKFIFNKPQHMHRISKLPRGVCWTLVLAGNKVREWGFKTREGWKHWTEFLDPENLKRFTLWCKDNDG